MTERELNSLIMGATRAQELLDLHANHGQMFTRVNLATCWSRLGRVSPADRIWLRSDDGAPLFALREQTGDSVDTVGGRAMSNIAHALAKIGLQGPAWENLWNELERAALARRSEFKPQELSNTAWAFATAGHATPALFDAIGKESSGRVRAFKPQELCNTAWAFATAGHAAPGLLDAIGKESIGRVREFKPQDLSNTAWAFATAGHADPALFDAIGTASIERVREFQPQELKDTAWAFATAGHATPALFDAIGKVSTVRIRQFTPQHLANTAWAFATAGHAAPALLDAIGRESAGRLGEFNPQGLANTAWAFATAGHAAPALFDAIATESIGRVCVFAPQNLANTAWAFATAGHAAPALFDAIGTESAGRVCELNAQDLANTAWAYAAMDHLPAESSLFDQRFAHRCDALAHEFSIEELCQLHQWRLWYAGERSCSDGLPGAALLARSDAAFRSVEPQPSRTQREVAKALLSLGASVHQEVVLEEGYSLDMVVDWRGQRLAVEAGGLSHFVGREPTAATLLKRRQLKHFGWRLVAVPYWEWDEIERHPDKSTRDRRRADYLSSLFAEEARKTVS